MRFRKIIPLVLASLSFACSEVPDDRSVTSPDALRFAKPIADGACASTLNRTIQSQMADLFARPELDAAKVLWGVVESQCGSDVAQARESMLAYVQFTIEKKGDIRSQSTGSAETNLISHWSSTFAYVGYTGADQPQLDSVPVSIFGANGTAEVVPASLVDSQEVATSNAALMMYAQESGTGDTRGHLFVIYPLEADCLGATNLASNGPCFEFGSFPKVAPNFDPMVKTGICQVHLTSDSISDHLNIPAIAHLTSSVTRITEPAGTYPETCGDETPVQTGSWHGGIRGIASRLAWHAQRALTPKPLYAVHGGLGGLGSKLSPHQAVDLLVFDADFEDDVVGQFPADPETGTFSERSSATHPGSILVQNSLGLQASKLAVLSQGGGNCEPNCGGLLLEGVLNTESSGVYATNGIYDAQWISLQDGPTLKRASFVLRSSSDVDLASVHYSTKSNAKNITFGNSTRVLANWVRYKPMHFRIRVDLDANTATLYIDHSTTAAASVTFPTTANFAKVVADFRGIDSGVMGWDNIKVERLPGT